MSKKLKGGIKNEKVLASLSIAVAMVATMPTMAYDSILQELLMKHSKYLKTKKHNVKFMQN